MAVQSPAAELDERYSSPDANPVDWADARGHLEQAEMYSLSTVRPDGRPHVTPLIAVWLDGALYFSTAEDERKYKNLARNPHVVLTTGCNRREGLDLVIQGDAERVSDESRMRRVADEFFRKYGEEWRFTVRDGAFLNPEGGGGPLYEVRPTTAFGFGRGEHYTQTRWRF